MITEKIQKNKIKGFVLLFTVVLSSMILAITLGILNIALKEINFTTSGKDTNDAFFAADIGAECALFYNKELTVDDDFLEYVTGLGSAFICNDKQVGIGEGLFVVFDLGSSKNSCALFSVEKDTDLRKTKIVSIGRSSCDGMTSYVERQLEVTY